MTHTYIVVSLSHYLNILLLFISLASIIHEGIYNNHNNNSLLLVNAFPTGAGGCDGNGPAVGGFHTLATKNVTNVSFANKKVTVKIGDVIIPEGGTATFNASLLTDIVVSGINIKGALLRISAPSGYNTRGVIQPGTNTKNADVCRSPIVGITQTNANLKSSISGKLLFPKEGSITLDITLVWISNSFNSSYSYGQFKINVLPGPPVSSPIICFSSSNTVEVKDIGHVPLSQLKIGDYVKTHDKTYTQVYGFGHYDHNREEVFLRMTFDNNHNDDNTLVDNSIVPQYLEISSNHLIFIKRNDKKISIRAYDVVVGDQLSNEQIVTSIEHITRRGVYAPLTQSGDMMISNVYVSNYVNVLNIFTNNNNDKNKSNNHNMNQHMIGHILFTPQRLFCQYYIETCKKEYYMNGYGLLAYIIVSSATIITSMIGLMTNIINILRIDYLFDMITSIPPSQFIVWLLLIPIIGIITIYVFSSKKQKIMYS